MSTPRRANITKNSDHPIAALRISLGMTQPAFAAALGVSRIAVCKWEGGEQTPPPAMRLLLGILRDHPELLTTTPLEIPEKSAG